MAVLTFANGEASKEIDFDFSPDGRLYVRLRDGDSVLNIWVRKKDVNVLMTVLNTLTEE
jgi:hypothetical protein